MLRVWKAHRGDYGLDGYDRSGTRNNHPRN